MGAVVPVGRVSGNLFDIFDAVYHLFIMVVSDDSGVHPADHQSSAMGRGGGEQVIAERFFDTLQKMAAQFLAIHAGYNRAYFRVLLLQPLEQQTQLFSGVRATPAW